MNWDAIGAIAELLGAVGVIASLIYLATQIRQSHEQMNQNTAALRTTSRQDIVSGYRTHARLLLEPGMFAPSRRGCAVIQTYLPMRKAGSGTSWATTP